MMTVNHFLKMITNPDRIKIVKGKEVLFVGYKGDLLYERATEISPEVWNQNGIFQNRTGNQSEGLGKIRANGAIATRADTRV